MKPTERKAKPKDRNGQCLYLNVSDNFNTVAEFVPLPDYSVN